ncbi:MAG TPA: sulfite exporter TauE/SafE family protein [Candidatus Baltobacteraceae bacterium]|nr:sulfite exporter TauE/SafE family protein [Candidatus Baltobacteraceae bacterium]
MGLLTIGVAIGTLGTLIGAGGGWVVVPLSVFAMGFSPQQAVGTSPVIVFLNAFSGSIAYIIQRRVLFRMGVAFALATIPGALLGATLVQYFSVRWFTLVFAMFLLLLAIILYRGNPLVMGVEAAHVHDHQSFRSPILLVGSGLSFFVGIISSLFGIGGGIIHVPFLIVALGLPVHVATATSHFVLAVTSLAGSLVFLRHGQIDFGVALKIGPGYRSGLNSAHASPWA